MERGKVFRRIGKVVRQPAGLAAVPARREQSRPVVRARARLDADHAWRQRGHHIVQLDERDLGLAQLHLTCSVHAVQCKHVELLARSIPTVTMDVDFPFRVS